MTRYLAGSLVGVAVLAVSAACSSSGGSGDSGPSGMSSAPAPASHGAASVTATGSSGTASLGSLLPASIRDSGKLNIESNVDYPPFEMYKPNSNQVEGLDFDIATALGKEFGVKVTFTNVSFDAIIPGLVSKRFPMAMSAISDTAKRREQVSFVDYFKAGGAILVAKGNPKHVTGLESLCGLQVAVHLGATGVTDAQNQSKKCTSEGKPALKINTSQTTDSSVLALRSGRVDATLLDSGTAPYVAAHSNGALEVAGTPYNLQPYGIAVPKSSTQLITALRKGLEQLIEDGTYKSILAKYGEQDGAIETVTINNGQ